MKAHIALQPTLLCCQLSQEQLNTLAAISRALRLEMRRVDRAQAGRTVGALCGAPGSSKGAVPVPPAMTREPVLVLYQFTEAGLDALLAAMKSGGVNIPLKAAVTPTNRDWPLCQLAAELEKEHAAVQAARPAGE